MIANKSPPIPTLAGYTTLSAAAVATAASMAFPPCLRISAPACPPSVRTRHTMPFRAMTSERDCGSHPSDRSPRTALHHVGVGVESHWRIGDCARAKLEPRANVNTVRQGNVLVKPFIGYLLADTSSWLVPRGTVDDAFLRWRFAHATATIPRPCHLSGGLSRHDRNR